MRNIIILLASIMALALTAACAAVEDAVDGKPSTAAPSTFGLTGDAASIKSFEAKCADRRQSIVDWQKKRELQVQIDYEEGRLVDGWSAIARLTRYQEEEAAMKRDLHQNCQEAISAVRHTPTPWPTATPAPTPTPDIAACRTEAPWEQFADIVADVKREVNDPQQAIRKYDGFRCFKVELPESCVEEAAPNFTRYSIAPEKRGNGYRIRLNEGGSCGGIAYYLVGRDGDLFLNLHPDWGVYDRRVHCAVVLSPAIPEMQVPAGHPSFTCIYPDGSNPSPAAN